MNKKIAIAILASVMFLAIIGTAKATIEASIQVKDSGGNSIGGETVPLPTVAYVYGTYKDLDGNAPASATMQVYYDDDPTTGAGWQYRATLFTGTVNDEQTIESTYVMTEVGCYQFRWRCVKESSGSSDEMSILCTQEVALALAQVFAVPEPGTLAGLLMGLSAFGFLGVRSLRKR